MGAFQKITRDYSKDAERYAEEVLSGKVSACELVKLACQRHLDDLDRSAEQGEDAEWVFVSKFGDDICAFIETLPHIKGRGWKSKNITLEDWQCFILCVLFGWIDRVTEVRRFTTAYIEVPRKNAKTTLCAGIALYMLLCDGEPGAEVYSAAVTRDQARIVWEISRDMLKRLPEFTAEWGVQTLAHSITRLETSASFKPLARDADTLEGLNPHCAVVDEVHAHKTREVWDVLNVARGSRTQSLLLGITTAGSDKTGICYEQHNYTENILRGRLKGDRGAERYFGIIYTVDKEDDWTTEASHRKANPNYGVSVFANDIETMCHQAMASAESQNNFLTKRLNVWVAVGTAYFNMLAWENLCLDETLKIEDFYKGGTGKYAGTPCILGIDLASTEDLVAKIYLFHLGGPKIALFGKYYIPETKAERGAENYDVYSGWVARGKIQAVPGPAHDFEFLKMSILEDRNIFNIREVGYDPYQAHALRTELEKEGVPMIEVGATVPNFSEPMKTLSAKIVAGHVKHPDDPVMSWCLANVMAKVDAKDNVYPRKARGGNKIDAAVAALIAMNRDLKNPYMPAGTIELW